MARKGKTIGLARKGRNATAGYRAFHTAMGLAKAAHKAGRRSVVRLLNVPAEMGAVSLRCKRGPDKTTNTLHMSPKASRKRGAKRHQPLPFQM